MLSISTDYPADMAMRGKSPEELQLVKWAHLANKTKSTMARS